MAATRKQQRREAREERLRREAEAAAVARRRRLTQIAAGAGFLAVVVIAALIVISQSGSDSGGDTSIEGASAVDQELRGLDQHGTRLGTPGAPATIVFFGDLQCPICREYSTTTLPAVIDQFVRSGEADLDFRNWIVIGPDSNDAAKAALAAAKQGRYWNFIEVFYRNQGTENSGYVTDSFLESVAKAAGVPDIDRWNSDRQDPGFESSLSRIDRQANQLGFTGTPSFLVVGPNGQQPVQTGTPDEIRSALNKVSSG
jgi:protein-disulfide isomerase